ncbi:hypothetical protein EXIGLDRAFT_784264 [Exidia glandulosa HHB12029]|uniref:Uncharacterized protein n=1 Tax=Exidia glandulosa HHB12029 TaxID=1314781 RepID=A0A166MKD0_EXIGL|nr:hypothetical protein EXIGLDRAFT_784264 [Exidia glandulosa HHB12029]
MGLPLYTEALVRQPRAESWNWARMLALAFIATATLSISQWSRPSFLPSASHPAVEPTVPSLAQDQVLVGLPTLSTAPVSTGDPAIARWCYFDEDDKHELPANYSHSMTLSPEDLEFREEHPWADGGWTFEALAVPDLEAVEVRAHFSVSSAKQGCTANICIVPLPYGRRGLFIVPHRPACSGAEPLVDVQATVHFAYPETASKPILVESISTDMKTMSQRFRPFRGQVDVSLLTLVSSGGAIHIEDLNANSAQITAWRGDVTVNVSLSEATSTIQILGGHMKASIALSAPSTEDVVLQVLASEGAVADFDLVVTAPASQSDPAKYLVQLAELWNASLRLDVVSLAPRSPLGITHIGQDGSRLELTLPSTFEGPFTFSAFNTTVDRKPMLVRGPDVPDPTGEHRNRTISSQTWDVEGGYHVMAGEAFWGAQSNKSTYPNYVLSLSNSAEAVLVL